LIADAAGDLFGGAGTVFELSGTGFQVLPQVSDGEVLIVAAGQTSAGITVLSGGALDVLAGGTAIGTTVSSGGIQYVAGTASSTRLSGGTEVVFGSAAGTTVDDGGIQSVAAGGTASDTIVSNGGIQYDAGTASDTTLSGGTVQVFSGGVMNGATISSGLLELQSGATAGNSTIAFAGGGTLKLDATGAYSFLVAGFAQPDAFDLSAVNFASATKQYAGDTSSGTLPVGDGTNSVSLVLLGNYTAASFNLGPESGGGTGTVVADPPLANGPFLDVTTPHG
jgi:autotransporter passenger strand-loop-strand repeat protein